MKSETTFLILDPAPVVSNGFKYVASLIDNASRICSSKSVDENFFFKPFK